MSPTPFSHAAASGVWDRDSRGAGAVWAWLSQAPPPPRQLDAGSSDSLALHSRDEQSVLVVSFADLKACLENTFTEVLTASEKPS